MAITAEVLHQILAVIPATFNDFAQGISYGWIAPTLLSLQRNDQFSITTQQLSWLGSAQELGKVIGPLIAALLVDRIGRKSLLILCSLTFFTSWSIISVSTSILCICVARFIFGVGHGMDDVTMSIYLGENFSPKLRAIFCSIAIVALYFAELIEFIVASSYSYRIVAAVNASIAFFGLLSTYFARETAQYLLIKKRYSDAEQNYVWLKGASNPDIDEEFAKIKKNVEEEQRRMVSYRKLLSSKANYKSLIITSLLCSFVMTSGGPAVVSYVSMLFSTHEALTPYQFTILFGFIRLVVASSVPFYVERFPRRTQILGCFFSITIVHLCTAILYYVHLNVSPIPHFSWFVFCTITMYASIFTILASVSGMMRGELFPQSIKALGGFISISMHSAVAFFMTKMFLVVKMKYGVQANFLFFSVMSFIAFVYNYYELPETRGKMLVDIQKFLEK